ncbi:U-box domain-containing protein 5-like [Juglans microcarpa x Juglans regia]|uniref:U-box domain-containing protein 5-like n=1 Tax=Juglans microcarpa x Juglans regia TaxID=2249226 RepID=UPI001B7E160A|nr:U-box domain-containing protein 5-like [Juglans microcarpa x Juglans regia]
MGSDVAEVVENQSIPCPFKVHCLMCTELQNLVDRISRIFPAIELARPRCSSGIQELCSLNRAIERANLLLQYCSESSKLYLALTGDVILSRFQRSRKLLEQSLGRVQTMVPLELGEEISHIMDDLRHAKFMLDSSEEWAGKAVRGLLHQDASATDSVETSEVKALQLAASALHISSPKAIVIEKRSIKKLLDKVGDSDPTKKKILKYLLYLFKKYGNLILQEQSASGCVQHERASAFENCSSSSAYSLSTEVGSRMVYRHHEAQIDFLSRATPPEEFKCPISSKLMYDPVVIASGQTFERMCIQKWFDEGNDTCPKTKMKLAHQSMTPNKTMKDLISKWCMKYEVIIADPTMLPEFIHSWEASSTSIASFGSSMNDLHFPIDLSDVSLGSIETTYTLDSSHAKTADGLNVNSMWTKGELKCQSNAGIHETDLECLSKLAELEWESQCKAIEDVKKHLNDSEEAFLFVSYDDFAEPIIRFLKDAHDRHDVKAQKAGCQLLLAYVSKNRSGISYLWEGAFSLLTTFLNSAVTEEALYILEVLSGHLYCGDKIASFDALIAILKMLDSNNRDFQEQAIKILCNLSSNSDVCSNIVSLECIPKLVPFLVDSTFAGRCVLLLKNLCSTEEARISVAETNGCIASIAELLVSDSHEDQENAVAVLLSLCSQRVQHCKLVMDEGVIPALVDISINGNDKGKASALELLRCLRDIKYVDDRDYSEPDINAARDPPNLSKERKTPKATRFFGKIPIFSKPISFTAKKKK